MKIFLITISLLSSFNTFSMKKKTRVRNLKKSSNSPKIRDTTIKRSRSRGEGSTCNNVINMQGQKIKLDVGSQVVKSGQGQLYNPDTEWNTLDFGGHGHSTNKDRRFIVHDANLKIETEFVFVNAYNHNNDVILKFKNRDKTISLKQKDSIANKDCYALSSKKYVARYDNKKALIEI